ncbi:hypothetical protein LG284_16575 (plasmid) [Citricoccus nitrophenolicus]
MTQPPASGQHNATHEPSPAQLAKAIEALEQATREFKSSSKPKEMHWAWSPIAVVLFGVAVLAFVCTATSLDSDLSKKVLVLGTGGFAALAIIGELVNLTTHGALDDDNVEHNWFKRKWAKVTKLQVPEAFIKILALEAAALGIIAIGTGLA